MDIFLPDCGFPPSLPQWGGAFSRLRDGTKWVAMSGLRDFFVAGPLDDGHPVTGHYYERSSDNADQPQVWGYTAALSYQAGDFLVLHAMSTATSCEVVIERDGITRQRVLCQTVKTSFAATPPDCSVRGCDWPVVLEMQVPDDWTSGLYRVVLTVAGHQSIAMFVLRAKEPRANCAFILTTGTWCAYNDWGGSNHYQGLTGPSGADFAPEVSLHRPWAKGFVEWPADAPRIPHASALLTPPRYPHMDYARAKGISKKYASSGWAAFERPFALWCEAQGIELDYLTQHDLQGDPDALAGYGRAVIVGHDEYWSWEMRDQIDMFVDRGGELARFGGNFFWQTRLSADLSVQTCYKSQAEALDPLAHTDRITSYWDHARVRRPGVSTMGLTGSMGVYAGWSRCAAHGSGGFTLYRPGHWTMAGTGLGYGDVLGARSLVFGYEVDGIDYEMRKGLPYPAADTGLSGELTLIALSPATTLAHSTGPHDQDHFIGHLDAEEVALNVYGEVTEETIALASRGNGCIAEYRRGRGCVVNVASCEWVAGLIARERPVEVVTRTLLCGVWPKAEGGAAGKASGG